MRLTSGEWRDFRAAFYCTSWPDEEHRVPVEVAWNDGREWTAFLSGDRMLEAAEWLRARRGAAGRPPLHLVSTPGEERDAARESQRAAA